MKNIVLFSALIFCLLIEGATTPTYGMKRQVEALDKGLVAAKTENGVLISWRVLDSEKETAFNVYKNGKLFKSVSSKQATNLTDKSGNLEDKYVVKAVVRGKETDSSKEVKAWEQDFLTIQLNHPEKGITPPCTALNRSNGTAGEYPEGQEYTYVPGGCSVGDLDGDSEYEIIVKWNFSNQTDNSHSGIIGPVYLDAYKLSGKHSWRINLGKNVRAGSRYTQFMVYDFNGDGKTELVCETTPGTVDGKGKKIFLGTDDPDKDWRNLEMNKKTCGYVLQGPEYFTIFSGKTGEELHTVPYEAERGEVSSWGDSCDNHIDHFLTCVAYLDGIRPSVVMCCGYYAKTILTAYDPIKGKLVKRWEHISDIKGEGAYGQGNHNLSVADADGDGCGEIVYGSCVINNDGTVLYSTGLGHGGAMHIANLNPDRPGYQVWEVHEEKGAWQTYGYEMHDARTGKILWGGPAKGDNGRGLVADIDPNHRGFEMWSSGAPGVHNCKEKRIVDRRPSISFRIYWDGDLQDEILNKNVITKWNGWKPVTLRTFSEARHTSGSKTVPNLSADIPGDWKEEIALYDVEDPSRLHIYTTTIPTEHRLYTLIHDPMYRLGIAWQNVGYNQPPHSGFYIGDGLESTPQPEMYTPKFD